VADSKGDLDNVYPPVSVRAQAWQTLAHGSTCNFRAIGLGTGTIVMILLLRRVIIRYGL